MKGFEKVCAMPLKEARALVSHPVACIDCHDPQSMQLRVTRPGFLRGSPTSPSTLPKRWRPREPNRRASRQPLPVPHLTSLHQWARHKNKGDRQEAYDVNTLATRQEMRSFVCGQCHVEYYFRGEGKVVTYPWRKGLRVEQIESYYDETGFKDYTHAETGAPILKAQHPEFELWNQGVHARAASPAPTAICLIAARGRSRSATIRSAARSSRFPRACQTCHRYDEKEILSRANAIQDRNQAFPRAGRDRAC